MVARTKTNLSVFENTRTTFQRLSDAKIFHGWIYQLNSAGVLVRLSAGSAQLNQDEECYFQVFGPQRNALFRAKLIEIEDGDDTLLQPGVLSIHGTGKLYRFNYSGQVKMIETQDSARFVNQCMNAAISCVDFENMDEPCPVIDVSTTGFSIMTSQAIERGREVRATIYTPLGRVDCKAAVRNCRPHPEVPGGFRIGFEITSMERIDEKRWQAVFRRIA
jgi:hypothetical protein